MVPQRLLRRVGDGPLRVAEIARAGQADSAIVPGLGEDPVERGKAVIALVASLASLALQ